MTLALAEPTSAPIRFSARIREHTRQDHEQTERSAFLRLFLDGRLSRDGFAALMGQLWFVYEALEEGAIVLRDDPVAGPFLDPRLARGEALDADLRVLIGDDWRARVSPSPGTRDHAERIRGLYRTWPSGFVAHHYTRYMGDLSGGKVLGKAAQRLYGLTGDGVRFYHFDGIPNGREFKDAYRVLLDTAPWDDAERLMVLDEIGRSFRMTGAMLDDLERDAPTYTIG